MNALAWDIERALQAHERQQPGRVVSTFAWSAEVDDLTAGETMEVRYGPEKGRLCVCVGPAAEPRSVRVRFAEREAVVRRDWLVITHAREPVPQPRKGPRWDTSWQSDGERWGDW